MVFQSAANCAPVRPGQRLQFDPLQPVQHAAGHFFVQPGRCDRCDALPAGDGCRVKCGWALCCHVFIVIFHRQACPEYIDRVFKRLLQNPFPTLANRIDQLSSLIGLRYDISDPIGGSSEEFRAMIAELQRLISKALPRIVQLTTPPVQPIQPVLLAHE